MSSRLKKDIFKLLREDEEFRYAVIGFLGLDTIYTRIDKIEEALERLEHVTEENNKAIRRLHEDMVEGFKRHDEILMKHAKTIEENNKAIRRLHEDMVEGFKRHDEEIRKIREDMKEGFKRHDERFIRVENELAKLREDMNEGFKTVNRHITALGARWGLESEEAFREALKSILEKELGVEVSRWTYEDKEGYVYGYPSAVEIDIAVKDDKVMLIEIKSSVSVSDIVSFKRKSELFEKVSGRKANRLMIVTPYSDEKAKIACEKFNIELYKKY